MISEHLPNKRLGATAESLWYCGCLTLVNEVHDSTSLQRCLFSNLAFAICIVLETLSCLFWIDARYKHIMQTKLTRKDILHVVDNVLDVVMMRKAVENVDMLQAKSNIAPSIQARLRMKHTASYKDYLGRFVLLIDPLVLLRVEEHVKASRTRSI